MSQEEFFKAFMETLLSLPGWLAEYGWLFVWPILYFIGQQNEKAPQNQRRLQRQQQQQQQRLAKLQFQSVDMDLMRKVYGILGQSTADGLLHQARELYPGRPEQWYWEKVLWDYQRDQRG